MLTDQQNKPVLDEQTFGKLLEAACVLQEHHRQMRKLEESLESQSEQLREQDLVQQAAQKKNKAEWDEAAPPNADYTLTLAEIVEAQHQIQMRHLGLDHAMAVVVERIARITMASGAGIGLLEGATVRYRAGAGSPSLPVGTEIPLQAAVCQPSVRTGQVVRTKDIDTEFLFDPGPVRERGICSLVAVPIHYDGNIVGALELYFDKTHGFAEQDIHTCQLMAGLVTEAMGREAGLTLRKSMAEERSSMLAAIEKLRPNLAAPAKGPSDTAAGETAIGTTNSLCWKCGNCLQEEEQFCGNCGAPRVGNTGEATKQSKLASAWNTQQAAKQPPAQRIFRTAAANGSFAGNGDSARALSTTPSGDIASESLLDFSRHPELHEIAYDSARLSMVGEAEASGSTLSIAPQLDAEKSDDHASVSLPEADDIVWTSAARAQEFLESLSAPRAPNALARFWRSRRGDFYLGIAIAMVVFVIGWGIWSNHSLRTANTTALSRTATGAKQSALEPNLSTFDKLLISLGLAEAPDSPDYQYKGNPDTQVWVDLNTAQYYCPGSDLFEKTPRGKLSSQREAQLDQFEPAYRKACD